HRLPAVRAGLPAAAAAAGRPLLPRRGLPAAPGPGPAEGGLFRGRLLLRLRDVAALGGRLPRGLGVWAAGGALAPPPGLRRPVAPGHPRGPHRRGPLGRGRRPALPVPLAGRAVRAGAVRDRVPAPSWRGGNPAPRPVARTRRGAGRGALADHGA